MSFTRDDSVPSDLESSDATIPASGTTITDLPSLNHYE